MKQLFCPKCGKIMKHKEGKLFCDCGFETPIVEVSSKEKMKNEAISFKTDDSLSESATYPHKCNKCGYDKAEIADIPPSYSDADSLILYKCGKCGHVQREKIHFT